MKPLKNLFTIFLISNSLLLFSQSNPVSIDLRNNGIKLDAIFYLVNEVGFSPTVIILHGFPGSPNTQTPFGLAEKMIKNGINVLDFNYEGSFNSEGAFRFENCIADAGAAVSFLKQEVTIEKFKIDTSRIYICGVSQGAAYALSSAIYNSDIKKIVAIGGGNDLSIYLQKMHNSVYRTAFEKKVRSSCFPGGPIKCDSADIHNYFNQIIDKYEYFDLVKNADKFINKKILFIAGILDTTVPVEEFIIPTYRNLKNRYPESVTIEFFETDHWFTNKRDELSSLVCEWIKNN